MKSEFGVIVLAIICCCLLGQCAKKGKSNEELNPGEEFGSFMIQFDRDTSFQRSRVRYKFDASADLTLSHIDTSQFIISTEVEDSAIVKVTYKKDTTYWVKFVFKKEDGKWFLVNYIDTYFD